LVGHMRFEALLLGLQAIRSRRQGNAVIAGAAGGGGPFHAGVNVLNRERQIGNDASACILYRSGYSSETALPVAELASHQKINERQQQNSESVSHFGTSPVTCLEEDLPRYESKRNKK